jgi:hypothetical protein
MLGGMRMYIVVGAGGGTAGLTSSLSSGPRSAWHTMRLWLLGAVKALQVGQQGAARKVVAFGTVRLTLAYKACKRFSAGHM